MFSDKFCDIHRHLINLGGIVLLNISQYSDIIICHEIDGDTLSTETPRSTNSMNIELSILRKIIANNERNLLNIESSSPNISCNENSTLTSSKFSHNSISFFLRHATMHVGDSEISISHLFSEPFYSTLFITENDSLSNSKGIIKIT